MFQELSIHVASGYPNGQGKYETYPPLEKDQLDSGILDGTDLGNRQQLLQTLPPPHPPMYIEKGLLAGGRRDRWAEWYPSSQLASSQFHQVPNWADIRV